MTGTKPGLRYFEDIVPGEVVHAGPIEVTSDDIIAFAQMYDPQPFHLDETAAAASLLGGLAASGWHTVAIGMRLFWDGFVRHVASMGAPGVAEVRWTRPVRPGDALSLELTVGETRVSASRVDRGYVAVWLDVRNGGGETVMTWRFTFIVQRRDSRPVVAAASAIAVERQSEAPPPPAAEPMLTAFFDDVPIGHESILGTQHFTPELIVGYAKQFDPQYFHVDSEAAKTSHFGGLIASGWQTAAFWMKHYIDARQRSAQARSAAALPAAVGGPSPGFADMKWLRPVRAGETVTYAMATTGKRRTSRPGWGLITTHNTGRMADGTLVFAFEGRLLWPIAP